MTTRFLPPKRARCPPRADPRPRPMASLRDVADRAGVSLATASRVASGSSAVRPGDEGARRGRDARPPLRPAGTRRGVERDRALRPGVLEPGLRRARRGDGDARGAQRPRDHPLQHARLGRPRARLRADAARARRRGDGLHLRRDHGRTRAARALREAPRAWRAARLRERRLRGARRDLGRRRRARRRTASPPSISSSSGTSASASSPATSTRSRHARRRSGTSTLSARRSSRTGSSRTRRSPSAAGARRCASCSRSPTAERPTAVICSSDLMAIGALQEAAALGLRRPARALDRGLRRDRRGDVDEPAADDGRAADRRDRANGGRGVAEPGRAPVRAAAELRLPSAASRSAGRRRRRRARPRRRRSRRTARTARPAPSRYVASPSRAKTRVAASRDAAVGEAVADVGEARRARRRRSACTARRTRAHGSSDGRSTCQPSGRGSSRFARDLELEPLALEQRLDELVEAHSRRRAGGARATSSAKPGRSRDVLAAANATTSGSGARTEPDLARDDLVQRQRRARVALSCAS